VPTIAASKSLEPVAVELAYGGHTLKQVFRLNSIAIYERARSNSEPHEFELVVIREKKASTLPNGVIIPERLAYASPAEWGRWAWSFPMREREFVFGLASQMSAMAGPYGAWVLASSRKHAEKNPGVPESR
jgi:hypothetical protein